MARAMSDAEIRRRKQLQGHISQTTSTLGLTGLGITGASALAARKTPGGAKVLGALRKVPGLKKATPEKMKNAAINTGIVSGGIGGVGGFNFASYTGAESKKRQRPVQPVKKELGMDMGYYGEEGRPIKLPEIKVPIEKSWEPVAGNYDPEAKRHKRAKVYEPALAGVGAGATGAAGYTGVKAGKLALANRKISQNAKNLPRVSAAHAARKASAIKGGKVSAGLAAGGAAALGASALVHRGRKGSWQSYGKRDDVSKVGEWKAIEQREQTQRGSRKTMRRATAGAVVGAGAIGYGATKRPGLGGDVKNVATRIHGYNKEMKGMGPAWGFDRKMRAKENLRVGTNAAKMMARSHPHATAGAGLIAGAAAVGAGAKAHHTYQQRKINQRRRANFKKSDSAFGIDHGLDRVWST